MNKEVQRVSKKAAVKFYFTATVNKVAKHGFQQKSVDKLR